MSPHRRRPPDGMRGPANNHPIGAGQMRTERRMAPLGCERLRCRPCRRTRWTASRGFPAGAAAGTDLPGEGVSSRGRDAFGDSPIAELSERTRQRADSPT